MAPVQCYSMKYRCSGKGKRLAPLMKEKERKFQNNTVMVTDLMERSDSFSIRLLEYFEKNFDVKLQNVKEKYLQNKNCTTQ